jgi:hypothetical protein
MSVVGGWGSGGGGVNSLILIYVLYYP